MSGSKSALLLLVLGGVATASDDPLSDARAAIDSKDYATAITLLEPLVAAGDSAAQSQLGVMYGQGFGVQRDLNRARELFELSHAQGDAFGAFNLAWMYASGTGVKKNCKKAMAVLHEPAESGNAIAQVNLASLYADGGPCNQRDFEEAIRWYSAAAEQGDALALHSLGAMHARGKGFEQSYKEAMDWYLKAAEKGYAESQMTIAYMYQYGQGVTADKEKAIHWYRLAAEQGDETAIQQLQLLEQSGDAGAIDEALLAAYLAAPAKKLAMEHNRIDTISMLTDIGAGEQMPSITFQIGDLVIGPENREQVRAEFQAKLASVHEAIARRGTANVAGDYSMKATRACRKIPSMWAQGIATKELGNPSILQSEHECQIVQMVDFNGREPLETPAVIVEDKIILADLMNTDFLFVGQVKGRVIEFQPDSDFILDAWPDWVNPPKRKDLDGCKVTLTKK